MRRGRDVTHIERLDVCLIPCIHLTKGAVFPDERCQWILAGRHTIGVLEDVQLTEPGDDGCSRDIAVRAWRPAQQQATPEAGGPCAGPCVLIRGTLALGAAFTWVAEDQHR